MCPVHKKQLINIGKPFSIKGLKILEDQSSIKQNELVSRQAEEIASLKESLATSREELTLLRRKEEFLQAVLENSFVGMAVIDLKGRFIHVNQTFCTITGYRAEELLRKTHLSIVHAESKKGFETEWKGLLKQEQSCFIKETGYQGKLEDTVWVRNSVSIMKDHAGHPEYAVLVCINIQEERRAQQKAEEIIQRFRFLADSMPQQIWTADVEGHLNYFSQAFYLYTGTTYEEIKNTNWDNIVYEDDLEITHALWMQCVNSGNEFETEHRLRSRDGNYRWHLSRAMPQRDEQGKIVMWVGGIINIHNQKVLEEQLGQQVLEGTQDLLEANFNLKHSNSDLEEFAYIATHDLKEPLRKIRTYSSWINDKFKPELPKEAQDFMLKIENASERMSKLIDDLLAYSTLLRPLEALESTDLNNILDYVLEDFDLLITEKDAVIRRTELPTLKAVPIQMKQLFHNLLGNALKFTSGTRQPVISVSCRIATQEELLLPELHADTAYIELVFSDNGIGFNQEYADKVFTIFKRLNSRTKFSGNGIGLALCQKIVLYHHGHIYVKAKENEGASFHILLPLSGETI